MTTSARAAASWWISVLRRRTEPVSFELSPWDRFSRCLSQSLYGYGEPLPGWFKGKAERKTTLFLGFRDL